MLPIFAFIDYREAVDSILLSLSTSMMNRFDSAPDYHQILYSWRASKHNYRGAASALYSRLQIGRNVTKASGMDIDSTINGGLETDPSTMMPSSANVTEMYLTCINILSRADPDDAWFLSPAATGSEPWLKRRKALNPKVRRRVVTLEDLREEYLAELGKMRFILNAIGQE